MASSANNDPTADIRSELQQLIETQIELGILVYDYQGTREAQEALNGRMNLYIEQLNNLAQTGYRTDVQVPLDVVEYIENGRNSDVYTREFVELLAKQNQYINGKIKAMDEFGDILAKELTEAYPEISGKIKEITDKAANANGS